MRRLLKVGLSAGALLGAVALAASSASCSLVESDPGKMVADSTLFVVGVLEASPDTVVHHPQVFVGRLIDPQNRRYDIFADREANLGRELFLPDLWAQVMIKAGFLHLRPLPEPRATVTVTGPLGRTAETVARFAYETRGVYGDRSRALPLVPGERYRLDVALPDGRRYTAETKTPRPYQITVPDTVRSRTQFVPHGPGEWSEIGEAITFPCLPDPDPAAAVSVWSVSQNRVFDAETFLEPSWQGLAFSDRGNHLRGTRIFQVQTPSEFADGMECFARWTADTNTSRWDESTLYIRLVQLSADLSRTYETPLREFTTRSQPGNLGYDDPWYATVFSARLDADHERDPAYLPSVSNLDAIAPGGARTKATDAVGVFGGLTARYLTRTIVPVRSFDPDTLDWHYPPGYPNP